MMELILNKNKADNRLLKLKYQIVISTISEHIIVHKSKIMYVKADGNYSIIEITDIPPILSSKTLKSYSERLGSSFLRVHQSYLINPIFIKSVSSSMESLKLTNGLEIPVSRSGKKIVQQFLNTYFD